MTPLAVIYRIKFLAFHTRSNSDLAAMTGLVGYGSSDEEEFCDDDQRMQLKSRVRCNRKHDHYSVTDWIGLRPTTIGIISITRAKFAA